MKFEIKENINDKIVVNCVPPLNCVKHGALKVKIFSSTGRLIINTELGEGCDYLPAVWFAHVEFLFFRFLRLTLEYDGQKYFLEKDQIL